MNLAAIIVAGGSGVRAGGPQPKQYAALGPKPVIAHALAALATHQLIACIQPVIRAGDEAVFAAAAAGLGKLRPPVHGGTTRQASVAAGLLALPDDVTHVLIHDAARPFLPSTLIDRMAEALAAHDAALAALPVGDTLKRGGMGGVVAGTVDRAGLWAAQTPQGFRLATIRAAHAAATAAGREDFTDDAAIVEWSGTPVALVMGARENWKITEAGDLAVAEQQMMASSGGAAREYRTGSGFDVHAFGPGDHVMLCGVAVPHEFGLAGHSDADVALHALTDAILGAAALGDIGRHFPPSDPQWKGAESGQFLRHAIALAEKLGARLTHVDVTIIGERPKIGPVAPALIARLADLVGLETGRVSVKATTTERLGFPGRGEGLAALATATLSFPA